MDPSKPSDGTIGKIKVGDLLGILPVSIPARTADRYGHLFRFGMKMDRSMLEEVISVI